MMIRPSLSPSCLFRTGIADSADLRSCQEMLCDLVVRVERHRLRYGMPHVNTATCGGNRTITHPLPKSETISLCVVASASEGRSSG